MESLRVNRGIKIEVNDEGECIFIDTENALLGTRLNALAKRLDDIGNSMEGKEGLSDEEMFNIIVEKEKEVMAEIDVTFGEDTCRKVFGKDVVPNIDSIMEFLELLKPIIEKHVKNRAETIKKKYAPRKGGKK